MCKLRGLILGNAESSANLNLVSDRATHPVYDHSHYHVHATERIPNGHSFNILHMEGIAGELKRAGITQNEMKSGEGYSK